MGPASARKMTRAASKDGYDPEEDLSKYYQDLTYIFPITLNNRIDKKLGTEWDVLNKSAAVDINYKIYPIYVFSVSPGDAPGDYYTVEGSFTVHNNSLWNPYHQLHGALKDFIIGYFMKDCSIKFELTDSV